MTVANLFAQHRAGKVSKEKFLYEVRRDAQLPFISNLTSYDDAIKMLKQKSIIKEAKSTFKVDPKYTHFAIGKADNKIVTGWDYKGLDNEEIKYWAKGDLKDMGKDMGLKLSDYAVVTTAALKKRGIDPFSWDNWKKEVNKSVNENSDYEEEDDDEDELETDYLEFTDGDTVVSMHKDGGGKWIESEVIEGKKPYGWGGKRYMSYLTPKEIASYLSKDYGGKWTSYEGLEEAVNAWEKHSLSARSIMDTDKETLEAFLADATKEDIIKWLKWNDRNGLYTDEEREAEFSAPLSKEEAAGEMRNQLEAGGGLKEGSEEFMQSERDLVRMYPASDYYVAAVELDNIVNGTTTPYLSISKKTGEKSKFGGDVYAPEKMWFKAVRKSPNGYMYTKSADPYAKTSINEQADLYLQIDRLNPILVKKAVNMELAKLPMIDAAIYQKMTERVVKKLQKDPRAYDEVLVTNAKEINKVDEKRKMVPVKNELKDPHHQMKSPKGLEKHKSNTKASKTENKKGKPKGVKEMPSTAKGHKGMDQMKQPEKSHKIMESLLSFMFKKKLNEDTHHEYGVGQAIDTPDGRGTVKEIIGSTVTLEFESTGDLKDYQMNVLTHFKEEAKKPVEEKTPEVKKEMPTMDEKKDKVIQKVMEFLKKKKKMKEVQQGSTQISTANPTNPDSVAIQTAKNLAKKGLPTSFVKPTAG